MDYLSLEKDFKVLSDKVRLQILKLIYDGQHCGCDLIQSLDIKQPTLSHHLKVLSENGFIIGTKEKQKTLYQVNLDKIINIKKDLDLIMTSKVSCTGV